MTTLQIGMKLNSTKTNKSYTVESVNEINNRIYLKCDNEESQGHILSKVIELIETGYYSIIEEQLEIVTDGKGLDGRVLVVSDVAIGNHNLESWLKLTTTRKGSFVTINKTKVNVRTMKMEYTSKGISKFYYKEN